MHARLDVRRIAAAVVILSGTLLPWRTVSAQTASPPNKPVSTDTAPPLPSSPRKTAPAKSANVKTGAIATLDAAADTLTLRERTGKTAVYVLTPKTHYNKNRRVSQLTDFKAGDTVVLHFRTSRTDGSMLVSELDDSASWTWLAEMRKTTTAVVIKEISEDTLSVTVGADRIPIDYTISDKTRWEKAGKEVDAAAFKAGDHAYVVPRSLPSGGIMARAVADTTSGASQEKERLATSVHGAIVTLEPSAHKVTLKTLAGDNRSLAYTDETEVVANGKAQTLDALKTGLHVAARVRHEAGGDEVVWRFTIETARKASASKKRPAAGKGVVTPH